MSQSFLLLVLLPAGDSPVCPPLSLADKVVVGSYMGMLRIFSPHSSKSGEGAQGPAETQLLEVQLQSAIIQVEVGKFVS